MNQQITKDYLEPTEIVDFDNPIVAQYAQEALEDGPTDNLGIAITLYNKVRDDIKYNPYIAFHRKESFKASNIILQKKGYCVSKAALLCALGRAAGIPSRLGFATVRNHIATKQLIDLLGTNEFAYHGYTEFFIEGKWVIATPAFDKETCKRHNVIPLEFDGINDSKYQTYDLDNQLFMEYLKDHGSYADVPMDDMLIEFKQKYGEKLVNEWIKAFDSMRGIAKRDFAKEEVV